MVTKVSLFPGSVLVALLVLALAAGVFAAGNLVTGTNTANVHSVKLFDSQENNQAVPFALADTVVPIIWDTVVTGGNVALTVDNRGAAGHLGIGRANMDFVRSGIDCDPTQTVYLYDLTPVLMTDPEHYSWNPYWTPDDIEPYNFMPVSDGQREKHFSGAMFDGYTSDKFVNSDSTIALVKNWFAPGEDHSFVVERIDIWSNKGDTRTGVRLGEWIDWNVPSDTGPNNRGRLFHQSRWCQLCLAAGPRV